MNASSPHGPSPSPPHSLHESETTNLERLVAYFVAAKRSLSATAHVYRANHLVDCSRSLVEECAFLGAKNAFLERRVNEEADTLAAVRDGLDNVARDAHDEFRVKVESIDIAHRKLIVTLDRLKGTVVDASLAAKNPSAFQDLTAASGSSTSSHGHSSPNIAPRTLHDFISEAGHQSLLDSLHLDIDSYNQASRTFQDTQTDFDESLASLADALHLAEDASPRARKRRATAKQEIDTEIPEPIPDLFQSLTTHATETASLLQSLIEHYDLCSTALKHTEGGGEAARAATGSSPDQTSLEGMDQSLFANEHREPITLDEKREMMDVLVTDAQEVDDVVLEIRDRLSEMESYLRELEQHTANARTQHHRLAAVLALLHQIGAGLGGRIVAARTFALHWTSVSEEMTAKMEDLTALTGIYKGFLTSYAHLLREVSRRQAAEAKVRRVLDEAKRKVDALCDQELELRKDFFRDVSDFMPRDIWADLEEAPRRYEWVAVDQPNLRKVLGLDEDNENDDDRANEDEYAAAPVFTATTTATEEENVGLGVDI
ncbi:hypothetical protein AAFC00_000411 [Neodothiora populina]|uniref:Autophagy-related protein 17 n=1 Tax=Neodothiora populina TaxID=2781224 RepID=A0ABR3PD92_9PEZI